jgi:hypothetical protein
MPYSTKGLFTDKLQQPLQNETQTPLRLLSQLAVGGPRQANTMPSDAVSEGFPANTNTAAGDPVHMPHPAAIQASESASLPGSGAWPQLVPQQHMNVALPPQNASATESLSGYQTAYTPDQTYIQPPGFDGPTHQLPPEQLQQQQQIQDFMAELDLITFQPEGLAMWGNMWDDMFFDTTESNF